MGDREERNVIFYFIVFHDSTYFMKYSIPGSLNVCFPSGKISKNTEDVLGILSGR